MNWAPMSLTDAACGRILSPLARLGKGDYRGVAQTNEDPLPQKTWRPPWKRGTNVETPGAGFPACRFAGLFSPVSGSPQLQDKNVCHTVATLQPRNSG
jgi:hypothetical protein